MDSFFAQLSDSVTTARTLEDLARPLLEMLEAVTGLESTYLTTVDVAEGLQHVVYARNSRELQIPEGSGWRTVAEEEWALLEKVTDPIATNPDATLRAHAQAKGWRIFDLFQPS